MDLVIDGNDQDPASLAEAKREVMDRIKQSLIYKSQRALARMKQDNENCGVCISGFEDKLEDDDMATVQVPHCGHLFHR